MLSAAIIPLSPSKLEKHDIVRRPGQTRSGPVLLISDSLSFFVIDKTGNGGETVKPRRSRNLNRSECGRFLRDFSVRTQKGREKARRERVEPRGSRNVLRGASKGPVLLCHSYLTSILPFDSFPFI